MMLSERYRAYVRDFGNNEDEFTRVLVCAALETRAQHLQTSNDVEGAIAVLEKIEQMYEESRQPQVVSQVLSAARLHAELLHSQNRLREAIDVIDTMIGRNRGDQPIRVRE
jgi:hypothetical protein